MYNAFQPGIFALSGWDLVGALPLPRQAVEERLTDGDTRWINRGAYDLMDVNPAATTSPAGLPKAPTLYGPISDQLQQPDSFASRLKALLAIRQQYRLYAARQVDIPDVNNKSLLVMVHQLPQERGVQVTALNFGPTPIHETVAASSLPAGQVVDMLSGQTEGPLPTPGQLRVSLSPYEGKSYLIRPG
jgi:trehalose synthase